MTKLAGLSVAGEGPGVITADGCAVEVYRLQQEAPEASMLAQLVPAGGSVLDLGAGTGRLAHALRDLGLGVTAVDESAAMLAQIGPGVTLVRSNIEGLRLGTRYDLVLLASHLINTDDDELRRGLLDACRRHVADTGAVVVQRHPPSWFDQVAATSGAHPPSSGLGISLRDVSRPRADVVAATAVYESGDRRWTHRFVARRLDDPATDEALAGSGLRRTSYLDEQRSWAVAQPYSG